MAYLFKINTKSQNTGTSALRARVSACPFGRAGAWLMVCPPSEEQIFCRCKLPRST